MVIKQRENRGQHGNFVIVVVRNVACYHAAMYRYNQELLKANKRAIKADQKSKTWEEPLRQRLRRHDVNYANLFIGS